MRAKESHDGIQSSVELVRGAEGRKSIKGEEFGKKGKSEGSRTVVQQLLKS